MMVEGSGKMFITGPQVIKAVTGEEVSAADLGGAMTHSTVSGVATFISSNDEECLAQIRRLLSFLLPITPTVTPLGGEWR